MSGRFPALDLHRCGPEAAAAANAATLTRPRTRTGAAVPAHAYVSDLRVDFRMAYDAEIQEWNVGCRCVADPAALGLASPAPGSAPAKQDR